MLAAWSLVGLYGTLGGYLEVNRPATLRFLLAVLVLVFAHHVDGPHARAASAASSRPMSATGSSERHRHVATGPQQTDG